MFKRSEPDPSIIIVRPTIRMDAAQLERLRREIEGLLIENGYSDEELDIWVGRPS